MSDLDWLARDSSSIEELEKKVVWFYKDRSVASQRMEEELERRNIPYITKWDPDSHRPRPAIAFGKWFLEGVANIQVYFLNALDHHGYSLEDLRKM